MKIEDYKDRARLLFEIFLQESNILTEEVRRALQSDDTTFLANWSRSLDDSVVRKVAKTYLTTRENLNAESRLLDSAEQLRVSSKELDKHFKVIGSQIADLYTALRKLTKTSELIMKRNTPIPWYLYDA